MYDLSVKKLPIISGRYYYFIAIKKNSIPLNVKYRSINSAKAGTIKCFRKEYVTTMNCYFYRVLSINLLIYGHIFLLMHLLMFECPHISSTK